MSSGKRVDDEVRRCDLQVGEPPLERLDRVDGVVLAGDAGDLAVGDLGLKVGVVVVAASARCGLLLLLALAAGLLLLPEANERSCEYFFMYHETHSWEIAHPFPAAGLLL